MNDWEELMTYFYTADTIRQMNPIPLLTTINPMRETLRRLEVPGGWIYEIVKYNTSETPMMMSTCFVPTSEMTPTIKQLREVIGDFRDTYQRAHPELGKMT